MRIIAGISGLCVGLNVPALYVAVGGKGISGSYDKEKNSLKS